MLERFHDILRFLLKQGYYGKVKLIFDLSEF